MVGAMAMDNNAKGRLEILSGRKQDGLRGLANNPYVLGVAIFASLGGFLFGYDQGVMSNVLTQENFGAHFPRIYSSPGIKGWVVGTLELGAWLGALVNGYFADRFSRKISMIMAIFVFTIGAGLQAGAHNEAFIFSGRFIGGFAVGMLSMVVPMYQSEISPPEIRGSLIALQQFSITIGILVSFWLDYGTHFIGGTTCAGGVYANGETYNPYVDVPAGGCTGQKTIAWRLPIGLQIVPGLILGIGMFFFPYSPRWLCMKGRDEEALQVVAKLRRLPVSDPIVRTEWLEIKAMTIFDQKTAQYYHPNKSGFRLGVAQYLSLFQRLPWFRRLALGCLIQVFQQFTGINAIIYYAPTIFEQLGLGANTTSLLATGVVGIVNVVFTVPAVLYLDSFGRRKIMMAGALGMFVAHMCVAGIIGSFENDWPNHKAGGWAGAAMIYVFIANFAFSWGPIGWVYPAEIMPMGIRSKALGITTSANWMMNFVVGLATPQMIANIKWGTYVFYGAFCFLAFLFTLFFIPETRHKSLEEMDVVFKDNTGGLDKERMDEANRQVGLTEEGYIEPSTTNEKAAKDTDSKSSSKDQDTTVIS